MGSEEQIAEKISLAIKSIYDSPVFYELKRNAQIESENDSTLKSTMKNDVKRGLKYKNLDLKLNNEIFKVLKRMSSYENSRTPQKEPLDYMREAQSNWERKIVKSVNSMSNELDVPLSRTRSNSVEMRKFRQRWNQLGVDEPDLRKFRPVYAPKDFLEVISGLRNNNYIYGDDLAGDFMLANVGMMQIPLKVPDLAELQEKFQELSGPQVGLVDYMDTNSYTSFHNDRLKMAQKVLSSGRSEIATHFCRSGVPTTNRAEMWKLALNITSENSERISYGQIKQDVVQYDLLVDSLLYKDVKLTAVNDDYYFVFEDLIHQILLIFSRDKTVSNYLKDVNISPPTAFLKGELGNEQAVVVYPPNGVIPFHGFSMYAAPFCFVYHDDVDLYLTFKNFYTSHLLRLHSISSHEEGIVCLCVLFEEIFQEIHCRLFRHLVDIGCQPLSIAFKWMMRGFSGYLATEQLLQLWDRIIGFNSLMLLPLLGVAIFVFRQSSLFTMETSQSVEAALSDISTMRVVPLLQMIIFPTDNSSMS